MPEIETIIAAAPIRVEISGAQGPAGTDADVTLANVRAAVPNMVEVASPVNDDLIQRVGGTWVTRTIAQIRTALGLGSAAYTASTAYVSSTANQSVGGVKDFIDGITVGQSESFATVGVKIKNSSNTFATTITAEASSANRTVGHQDKDGTYAYTNDVAMTDERVPTAAGLTSKFSTAKATPVGADGIGSFDSAASNAPVKTTYFQAWTNYFKGLADLLFVRKTTDLLERFDITSRWADNATITHLVTMPEVGAFPWRLSVNGTAPKVRTAGLGGGLIAETDESLWYLGNKVPTPNGKMNLGFVFEATTDAAGGPFNNGFNVSFSKNVMLPDGGGIDPTGVVHINVGLSGISSIIYFGGAAIPCVNATFEDDVYKWNKLYSAGTSPFFAQDRNYAIIFRVDGDELTITVPGVGELVFQDAGLSELIGSEYTNFWFEAASGVFDGSNYAQITKLRRVWSSEALNYDPAYGGLVGGNTPTMGGLGISKSNAIQQFGEKLMFAIYPANSKIRSAGTSTVSVNGSNRAKGGDIFTECVFSSNVGGTEVSADEFAIAPMEVDCNQLATLSSAAGAETVLKSITDTTTLRAGDFVHWEWFGQLTGVGTKRIRIVKQIFGSVFFDSGSLLNAVSGAYHLRLIQGGSTASSHVTFAVLNVDGLPPIVQRLETNIGGSFWPFDFRTTTSDAGGVTLDLMKKEVHRVKNP